jgi:hypothetical protein
MKTDELIGVLATGVVAIDAHVAERRYAKAIVLGTLGAALLMALLLKIRADLLAAILLPMFWIKSGFVASLVAVGLFASMRLSRPGARLDWVPVSIAIPIVMMWAIAGYALIVADPQQRSALFLGETWNSCPLLIAMLSLPVFVAVIWAMKGLAPTRLRLAGFSAGLLSGATAALVYCLHCPEMGAPFVGFWYLLGMLIPAAVGAWLGESLLHW